MSGVLDAPGASTLARDAAAARTAVPRSLPWTAAAVYAALALDVVLAATLDVLYEDDIAYQALAACVQLLVLLGTVLLCYVLVTETVIVKMALYDRVYSEFRGAFWVVGVYLVLFVVAKLQRLALLDGNMPHLKVWDEPAYLPFYVVQRLFAVVYYSTLVAHVRWLLSEPRLFAHPPR